jgi:hypothetical protein
MKLKKGDYFKATVWIENEKRGFRFIRLDAAAIGEFLDGGMARVEDLVKEEDKDDGEDSGGSSAEKGAVAGEGSSGRKVLLRITRLLVRVAVEVEVLLLAR